MKLNKSYSELSQIETFEDRLSYLKLKGKVGQRLFGHSRYINQAFYKSYEWKRLRAQIITRDWGCDLGVDGYTILDEIYIHHINPITKQDFIDKHPKIYDPNNLISTSLHTHNQIHYVKKTINTVINRKPNDTIPWR
jgi:hypothetical protein